MRAKPWSIVLLMAGAGSGLGCGGDGEGGPSEGILTTVEVIPATASLFTVAPGNTLALEVQALDQNNRPVEGSSSFSSDNSGVATVSSDGTVTAAGAGTAVITVSVTAGGVTRSGTSTVTGVVAPTSAQVMAPQLLYQPQTAEVSAGGAVTWTFGSIHHSVSFTTAGSPLSIPELENGSASRTFPDNGTFHYRCSFHPQMSGVVRVH